MRTTLRSVVVAAVKKPVTTTKRGLAVLWHRPSVVITGNLPADLIPEPVLSETPGTPEFERMLDSKGFPRAEEGTLKWLVDGDEFFGEFDRQLAGAKKSFRAQFYIFDNDDIAVRYADKLKARSQEIDVDVLYDDMGSASGWLSAPLTPAPAGFEPPADMKVYLERDSKVEVRRNLNPWAVADHTKLVVIDGRTAILGGMNHWTRIPLNEWHDLMVRVEGPVVGVSDGYFPEKLAACGADG